MRNVTAVAVVHTVKLHFQKVDVRTLYLNALELPEDNDTWSLMSQEEYSLDGIVDMSDMALKF